MLLYLLIAAQCVLSVPQPPTIINVPQSLSSSVIPVTSHKRSSCSSKDLSTFLETLSLLEITNPSPVGYNWNTGKLSLSQLTKDAISCSYSSYMNSNYNDLDLEDSDSEYDDYEGMTDADFNSLNPINYNLWDEDGVPRKASVRIQLERNALHKQKRIKAAKENGLRRVKSFSRFKSEEGNYSLSYIHISCSKDSGY